MSQRTDPHPETAYWVIPLDEEAFAVEVITPWHYPTTVSTFASAADAKAWIAAHRSRSTVQRWFSTSGNSGGNRRGRSWRNQRDKSPTRGIAQKQRQG
jgi:hypothetical protein